MDQERRILAAGRLEVRGEDSPTITGYASVFNQETVIGSWFREVILPGAFTEAVGRDDVRALFNHDPSHVLGRTAAHTLQIEEDSVGLRYEITPPDTQFAHDLVTSIKRGDISQSSFAFTVAPDGETWDYSETKEGKLPLRKITKVEQLWDVSPVTYPAYEETSVSARAKARAGEADARAVALAATAQARTRWARARHGA